MRRSKGLPKCKESLTRRQWELHDQFLVRSGLGLVVMVMVLVVPLAVGRQNVHVPTRNRA